MENKKTLDAQIHSVQRKRPNGFIYSVLRTFVAKPFMANKFSPTCNFKTDFRKDKGPYFLISNHASRIDFAFNAMQLKNRCNFVVGYNEFFRSHLQMVMKITGSIPKKNFVSDYYAMKQMASIIKQGGSIAIWPEGMNSIGGMSQPIVPGTGKFLKHFGIPVYYSVIKGGYLAMPKFNQTDRIGPIEVDLDIMFTPDQLKELSPEEIEDIINEKMFHDDYRWNLEKKNHYKAKDGKIAEGMETVLYRCPKCGSDKHMKTELDKIWCDNCGNGATILDTYEMVPLNDECILPETESKWFNDEREIIKEEIKNDPNYSLTIHVKLGNLPKYEFLKDYKTSLIVGEGDLTISRDGLTYNGTRDNEPFTFHLTTDEVPTYGMCTDVSRFYTFYNGEFMEFYPEENVTMKFFMATEELHRVNGGKWQDFKFDKNVHNN